MVYIKLSKQEWVVLGLANYLQPNQYSLIQQTYYLPYKDFKIAAEMTDQPLHSSVRRENIITNLQMKKIKRKAQQTPEERKMMENILARQQMRKLNKHSQAQKGYYFEDQSNENIKDLSKSISFGMTFIFTFFMAGLTGYYFGIYFLGLNHANSLIVAMVFIIFTIVIETTLYIIRQDRQDSKKLKTKKQKFTQSFKGAPAQKGTKMKKE